MPDYPKEQLWELYQDLPETLQKALFSEEVADNIYEICQKNKIEKANEISRNIGYVFSGLLPPSEFKGVLSEEIGLDKKKAESVSTEIERFIFLPLKKNLEALYKEKIKGKKIKKKASSKKTKKKDSYRESIE